MLNIALKIIAGFNWLKHRETPLPVLYFHRVMSSPSPYCPDDWTTESFYKLVAGLNNYFTIMPLSYALKLQADRALPANPLCITFDDGYIDNYTNAVPILESFNIKASFFIATLGTQRGFLWNDELAHTLIKTTNNNLQFLNKSYDLSSEQLKANTYLDLVSFLKTQPNIKRDNYLATLREILGEYSTPRCMMNAKQLNALQQKGHDIGAHSHTHSILSYQDTDTAFSEISESVTQLNQILSEPVSIFAYPNGWYGRDFNNEHEEMLHQLGIKYGVSTNDGGITTKTKPTRLPRFMPHRKQFIPFCLSIQKIAGE